MVNKKKITFLNSMILIFGAIFIFLFILLMANSNLTLSRYDRKITDKILEFSTPIIKSELIAKIEKFSAQIEKELNTIKSNTKLLA